MEPVYIAALAVAQVIFLAVVTLGGSLWSNKQAAAIRADEKRADYERQDEVARRVAAAARQAADAAALSLKVQKETVVVGRDTQTQLKAQGEDIKKIHILVNSDMTAARTAERDSLRLLIMALRRAQTLGNKLGVEDEKDDAETITRVEKRVAELDQILADRLAAQKRVDEESDRS